MVNQARFYLTAQEILGSHRSWITTSYCEHHLTEREIADALTESGEYTTPSQIHNCLISWSIIPSPYTALAAVAGIPQPRDYQHYWNDSFGMNSSSPSSNPPLTSPDISPLTDHRKNTNRRHSVKYIDSPSFTSPSKPNSRLIVKFLSSTNSQTNDCQPPAIQYPDSPTFPTALPSSPLNFTNGTTVSQTNLSSARLKLTCHHGSLPTEYHETSTRLSTMPTVPGPSPIEIYSTCEIERNQRLAVQLEREAVDREHLGIIRCEYKRAGEFNVRLQAKRIRSRKRRGLSKRDRSYRRRGVRTIDLEADVDEELKGEL